MNFRISAVAILLAGLIASTSFAVDPAGTWRWEHQDPTSGQTIKDVLTLSSANGNISGSYEMAGVAYDVNNGKLDGNTLSWDFNLDAEGQVINISFSGAISGDAVAGTVNIGDFGEFPWEAARDVVAGATSKWIVTLTKWDGKVEIHELMVTQNDGQFSAVYHADGNAWDVEDYTVGGDGTFSFKVAVPEKGLTAEFSGTSDGNIASGVVIFEVAGESGEGEIPFTAERSAEYGEAARDVVAGETSKWILSLTKWDGSVEIHELMVTQNDGQFSAVYHANGNVRDVEDYTVEGDGTFSFKLTVPERGLTAEFSGTSDGNTASGVIIYEVAGESGEGEIPFTAERSAE